MKNLQERWNARWAKVDDTDLLPDPWLEKIAPLLRRRRALDVACGAGRNAIFLAQQQFDVTAVDLSQAGLDRLNRAASARGLAIETHRVDLEGQPVLPAGPFDLVLMLFYLHRPLLPHLKSLLRPGGLFALRTFSCAGPFSKGPANPAFVLNPGELLEIFQGWEILSHEEGLEPSRKGGSLAGVVARRPSRP